MSALQDIIAFNLVAGFEGDASLASSISTEMSRAMGIEASLQSQMTQEVSDRIADVNNEMYQRETAIENVQEMIGQEQIRAEGIEASLQSQITQEVSDRVTGDYSTLSSAQLYADSAISALIPAGLIHMFAGTIAPSGYLLCDGSAVSRSTYSALFAVISTTYGTGNGSTTFNLPNPDSNANIRLIIKV
jgi:hypothetical protein